MIDRSIKLTLILVLVMFVGACFPGTTGNEADTDDTPSQSVVEQTPNGTLSETPPDTLVERLEGYINERTGIPREAIALQSAQAVDWDTACLGVASADEFCAQVITPGYQIIFNTPEGAFQFHTDRTGAFRLADAPAQWTDLQEG